VLSMMASVNTLLDFDGPSLPSTQYEANSFDTANINSVSLNDPFAVSYEVRLRCVSEKNATLFIFL